MIGLDDPIWQTLKGGYGTHYDASVRLRELEAGSANEAEIWDEFWCELHHQGTVDIASYATIPHLVRICIKNEIMDWNVFALVATIEECRTVKGNPELLQYLEADYHASIKLLAEFGAQHFHQAWPKNLTQSFLAVAAFAKQSPNTGRALITISEEEFSEAIEKFFS